MLTILVYCAFDVLVRSTFKFHLGLQGSNFGTHDHQVKKVNGVEVENLKHLCGLVEDCREECLRFDLDDERVIVLNYNLARVATSRILKRHRIPSAMSTDIIEHRQTVSEIEAACISWHGKEAPCYLTTSRRQYFSHWFILCSLPQCFWVTSVGPSPARKWRSKLKNVIALCKMAPARFLKIIKA